MPRIAVVGAGGFVGQELLRLLEARQRQVTAIVRAHPQIAVRGTFHDACAAPRELEPGSFDVVINLAYPTGGSAARREGQNDELFETIEHLLANDGRLIHVSTLAVFGTQLDREIALAAVRRVRDTVYVESKVSAELRALRLQRRHRWALDVVRLGNVVGPGSPTWIVPLVGRLATGRPVRAAGAAGAGFSNATDVANVAAFLADAIDSPNANGEAVFHHVAEFSAHPWSAWVDPLAAELGVSPVAAFVSPGRSDSTAGELIAVARALMPSNVYSTFARERVVGSWTRTFIRHLPGGLVDRAKGLEPVIAADSEIDPSDVDLLRTVAAPREFRSAGPLDNWVPPLTLEQSVERVLDWLRRDWSF